MKAQNKVWLEVLLAVGLIPCYAEVKFDNSLGDQVTADSLSGRFEIPVERGELRGGNVFHSFETFSINQGEAVTFTGPENVQNILSRVTGSEISNIDGLLRSTIPGADLHLINPNGIIFGQNAKLDVQGSFHVGTADYIKFDDGAQFAADQSSSGSSLTAAAPTAFGFLTSEGSISVDGGTLRVNEGEQLSFVSADSLTVRAGLLDAPQGQIVIKQLSAETSVESNFNTPQTNLNSISKHRTADSKFPDAPIENQIYIRSGLIEIGGGGTVGANGVKHIDISGNKMRLTDGSRITGSSDQGSAGNIKISMSESIEIEGRDLLRRSSIEAISSKDRAGQISIRTPTLEIENSEISASRTGESNPGSSNLLDAGLIDIEIDRLSLNDFASIGTQGFGNQPAGQIAIAANESVALSRQSSISSRTSGSGKGGNIQIRSVQVRISGGSEISTTTTGKGQGGAIELNTFKLTLADGSAITAKSKTRDIDPISDEGRSGDIKIVSNDQISIKDNSEISVNAEEANAGSIGLSTRALVQSGGTVSTSVNSRQGKGGIIAIKANLVSIDASSTIEANAALNQGGTIDIVADSFFGPREKVTANANGPGGIDGEVNISPVSDFIGGTVPLPKGLLDVYRILSQRCANRVPHRSSLAIVDAAPVVESPDLLLTITNQDFLGQASFEGLGEPPKYRQGTYLGGNYKECNPPL